MGTATWGRQFGRSHWIKGSDTASGCLPDYLVNLTASRRSTNINLVVDVIAGASGTVNAIELPHNRQHIQSTCMTNLS